MIDRQCEQEEPTTRLSNEQQQVVHTTPTRVTITVEKTHDCGQVIQEITTLCMDEDFSLSTRNDPPISFPSLHDAPDLDRSALAVLLDEAERRKLLLSLHGAVEGIDVLGCTWTDKGLRCLTCGANMLFPEDTPTFEPDRQEEEAHP